MISETRSSCRNGATGARKPSSVWAKTCSGITVSRALIVAPRTRYVAAPRAGSWLLLLELIADGVGLVTFGRQAQELLEHLLGARAVVIAVAIELAQRQVGMRIFGPRLHQHVELVL